MISNVVVIGLLSDHASLRRLQLLWYDNSGVYAIIFLLSFNEKGQPTIADCPYLKFMVEIDPPTLNPCLLTHLLLMDLRN